MGASRRTGPSEDHADELASVAVGVVGGGAVGELDAGSPRERRTTADLVIVEVDDGTRVGDELVMTVFRGAPGQGSDRTQHEERAKSHRDG